MKHFVAFMFLGQLPLGKIAPNQILTLTLIQTLTLTERGRGAISSGAVSRTPHS